MKNSNCKAVQLSQNQLEKTAKVARSLFEELDLAKFNQFIIFYAWQCAEQDIAPNAHIFALRAELETFKQNMALVGEMA